MSQKLRKTLIMVVMAALIICLMAASLTYTFTYGRYAGGKFDEESPYGDLIEFVGANQYTVRTPEELIQAIEDGYSNIKIADDAEEPFVIDTGVTDVSANLVLDVNGKTLIRNSRNPMLDVQTNVSVVLIYDSSDEEQGGFYNPVGSALQASGGTLTVGSGNYDDGPKKEEYNEYNGINSNHGTLGGSNPSVTLYARDNAPSGHPGLTTAFRATTKGYTHVEIDSLPTITPKIVEGETDDASDIVYGNIYLENGSTLNTNWLPADTFLLYTEEQGELVIGKLNGDGDVVLPNSDGYDDLSTPEQIFIKNGDEVEALSVACNVASCDFYYYYDTGEWIGADGKRQQGERPTTGFTPIYAVIYGYWDVMALARDDKENETDAEGMATALMDRGLVYPFAAVRMVEGEGFARGGQFSNNFGTVNSYGIYANGGALTASGANFTTGGDGVCIRCEGSASLSIGGGTYSSAIGNTIEMSGGTMNVTKGTFTKDASVEGAASGEGANNGSAIDIQGGTLNMAGAETAPVSFTVTGNYVNGVRVGDPTTSTVTETATIENAVFNFNKGEGSNSVAGVRSFGGTLTVRSSTFNISNGATSGKTITRAAGLSTQGGTVMATACIFNFAQENATVFPTASAGISSLGGTVTATDSTFTIPGNNNYGIYSSITSGVTGENQYDTKAANCTFKLTGNNNNGIYALGGKTLASGGTITLIGSGQNSDNFGIYSQSGTTTAEGCTITITGTYSAGALSYNGTIYLNDNTVIKVTESGVSTGDNTLLTSSAVSSEASTSGDHPINMNGNVTITSDGLGITARGNINVQSGKTTITTERATGIYVQGGILTVLEKAVVEVNSEIDSTCSWVVPPEHTDDESLQTNIYNGVFVNGGSLISNGTLNVTFTGVESDAPGTGENNSNLNGFNAYRLFQIKSYAVRVEGSGATTVMITSGTITNEIGGGVLVNGGTVELGTANDTTGYSANNPTGLTVQTTGTELYYDANSDWISNQLYDAYSDRSNQSNSKSWKYLLSSEGGPAIKIVGGTLKVNGGKYTAQQGDGIVTNGGSSYIYNGVFIGKDSYTILDNDDGISFLKIEGNVTTTSPLAGPAASYAFKVYSGTATVYGGTFGDPSSIASGAFVMGTEDSPGTANIFGGTFDVSDSGDNGGQAGFSAYVYTNVTFTEDGSDENGTGGKITVQGLAAGLTLESAGEGSNNPYQGGSAQVIINSGSFSSMKNNNNSDGIWYGNGSTTLNISGGTFTGAARSGLYFEVAPTSGGVDHVTLSGGTYHGSHGAINAESPESISTGNIIASNAYCFNSVVTGQGEENKPYAICKGNYRFFWYEYTHVGGNGGNESVNLDERTYINGLNGTDFNGRGTIYISDQNGKVENYTGPLI